MNYLMKTIVILQKKHILIMYKTGIVFKSTGHRYIVKHENKFFQCFIKGKFRTEGIKTTNPIAVGDVVDFETEKEANVGVIRKIHTRKNYIIRKSINLSKQGHIIAANIDIAFLVVTLSNPKTYPAFIDRFLVTCEAYKITAIIIFNKIDIYNDAEMQELQLLKSVYESIGYRCIEISVKKRINISNIIEIIENKTIVLSGNSGVGKSSLINLLKPGLELKTGIVSESHNKGKHTTTFAEMFEIAGGLLIDTPGIKAFGLSDMENTEISHYFPEMFILLKDCKYANCTHTHEPSCAVKTGILNGTISETRYKSYLSILNNDDSEKYRQDDYK